MDVESKQAKCTSYFCEKVWCYTAIYRIKYDLNNTSFTLSVILFPFRLMCWRHKPVDLPDLQASVSPGESNPCDEPRLWHAKEKGLGGITGHYFLCLCISVSFNAIIYVKQRVIFLTPLLGPGRHSLWWQSPCWGNPSQYSGYFSPALRLQPDMLQSFMWTPLCHILK